MRKPKQRKMTAKEAREIQRAHANKDGTPTISQKLNQIRARSIKEKLMMPHIVVHNDTDIVLVAQPIVTSHKRAMIEIGASAYLRYEEVEILRNWLNDWLGTYRDKPRSGPADRLRIMAQEWEDKPPATRQ